MIGIMARRPVISYARSVSLYVSLSQTGSLAASGEQQNQEKVY